ncbi:hypothetical protein PSECIP111951_02564 [Pseudoalteromonas holothuriae]|uniref:HTH araC/xylS-type domain-containing protein n=1 Tax=Pseudoalteromonas holothuriae TaxID=2963714 RepID=A0ABM9GJM5_9GAMM|nr:helix-turn-helix domain-containing protein [Pseudoalteromonas sp. CIP111951]CAH9061803.1 hypothetical protein PSECIP111951_02564 [Pseudoalteromonas sp. CIP111951]
MSRFFEINDSVFTAHSLILPIVEMASQRGIAPDKILKGSKLFYTDLNSHYKKISFAQLHTVIFNTTKLLSAEGISFLLSERLFHSMPSNALQALLHAAHLQQMFRVSQLRQFELFPYMFATSYRSPNQVHFVINFAISEPVLEVRCFFYELLAGLIECLLKWRFNTQPKTAAKQHKLHIRFPMEQPAYIEQFHSHLNSDYCFSQPAFMISLESIMLRQKHADSLPAMTRFYLKQPILSQPMIGFKQHISQLITQMPKATSEQIAQQLNISSATLKRKLKQHNTTLKTLKDELQKQQSLIYITERGYSNEQVATALAFNDITNFRRAFKRWTGKTPSELRACISKSITHY